MKITVTQRIALVVLVIAGTIGWVAWQDASARRQQWEGKIVHTYRTRRWWRGLIKPNQPLYHYYTHYWKVRTSGGQIIDAEASSLVWKEAKPGDPVHKRRGKRWPQLDTPHATRLL